MEINKHQSPHDDEFEQMIKGDSSGLDLVDMIIILFSIGISIACIFILSSEPFNN